MNILYDTTYCFRGNSGIPNDARSLARILENLSSDVDFALVPKQKSKKRPKTLLRQNALVGDAFRLTQGENMIPVIVESLFAWFTANLSSNKIKLFKLHNNYYELISQHLSLKQITTHNFLLSNASSRRIWGRAISNRTNHLNTKGYDIFIQQHVEPLKISKKTSHFVRLHDILPITHPQFFTQKAVQLFTKGLHVLLKDRQIIWVMDSISSANEFKILFGFDRNVAVVPCAIKDNIIEEESLLNKKNNLVVLGTIEPRKQVNFIIRNFLKLKDEGKIDDSWNLIIAGKHGWQEIETYKWIRDLHAKNKIVFIENPTDNEVGRILLESSILLSASLAEGFGLTPLEGLSYGCQLVVSNIPQHQETVANFANFFDPRNDQDFCSKLIEETKNYADINDRMNRIRYVKKYFSEQHLTEHWKKVFETQLKLES